jgi:hypothetical protein
VTGARGSADTAGVAARAAAVDAVWALTVANNPLRNWRRSHFTMKHPAIA